MEKTKAADEFEQCKKQIKITVEDLINNANLAEAKKLIEEYQSIVKNDNDVEIFLMKARIRAAERPNTCEVIVTNTDNQTAPQPGENIYSARNNVAFSLGNSDAPLVSIVALGYNNLEKHTKTCIECILKYTTNIDYELILVDNGSADATFEYFKSVPHPNKKIVRVTKNIGAFYGANSGMKLASGNYVVGVSNDIYVTKNWLVNMLKCAMSDERIGMVVPVSDNVSNLQSVNLNFTDFNDMQKKAAAFNISDARKWHERLRLIPPTALFSKACLDMVGIQDYGFFHDFADDDLTFRVRRAGYKAILCKDVFVQHAGHTIMKNPEEYKQSLAKGRITFKNKYYGLDAWDDVNNYETTMMSYITGKKIFESKIPNILGIDVSCGTPLLEIKNSLRDKGIFNVRLSAFSAEAKYWLDLKTICDGQVAVDRTEYISEYFRQEKFDYILLGKPINTYRHPYLLLEQLLQVLEGDGQLLLKLRNTYDIGTLFRITGVDIATDSSIIHHISLDEFNRRLQYYGCCAKDIVAEPHPIDKNMKKMLDSISFNTEEAYLKAAAKDYILNIGKKA
ncbi:MAG TPA: glycosyltransferase family 2 protein [Methylomusa anaerophila]|uniref:Putative glycosyltransferase EpsJ n=1 Tax=Methylomusa anaerophila TaxID=1930071 RepID=A0A348AH70_9FIRM|nr:glycosyltransferase family 2 protein [Methylomusa anaerophila]BBB90418.1 putative glycosyltransferase EpsJ [Methylomusa anaerophila]HML90367.1 glycosyltransferase family 2 protein [Methylomusa anaerophila]